MSIQTETAVSIKVDRLPNLSELRPLIENTNTKINISKIARQLNVDRLTVDKYLNDFEKSIMRNKKSNVS